MLRRIVSFSLVAVASGAMLAPAAVAQDINVNTDQQLRLDNNGECAPATEAVVSHQAADGTGPLTKVGSTITDASGSFDFTIADTSTLPLGPILIVVECDSVQPLVYPVIVAEPGTPAWQNIGVLGSIGAIVVLVGAIMLIRKRGAGGGDQSADAGVAKDTPIAAPAKVGPQNDDESEYWVWEHQSEAGPRKRVACLTEQAFYLHELPDESFPELLNYIQGVGPDAAFADAHYRFQVAQIGEAARRGNLVRVTSVTGAAQVIDVGEAAEDVFSMLRRRLGDDVCHEISVPANA